MTRRPVLSSHWDDRRGAATHKITIEGTSKYILLTDETLRDLQSQIDSASKGNIHGSVRT